MMENMWKKMSFMFDLKCLFKTFISVIKGEGVIEAELTVQKLSIRNHRARC